MTEEKDENDAMKGLSMVDEHLPGTAMAPAHGIAAIAMTLAMKYHDISTVQDGALYQQYKLEGRNFRDLHLDMVFETAIRIEQHLLASSDRIAKIIVDALAVEMESGEDEQSTDPQS